MFTGIIQDQGKLISSQIIEGDTRFVFEVVSIDLTQLAIGDSIAVNGCCLTAVEINKRQFAVDASLETLNLTTLASLSIGESVNLELAMTPQMAFGGHIVSGHVDGIGEIVDKQADARSWRFEIRLPDQLSRYIVAKGSVTIDGVSLTVNNVDANRFGINIIPHTMAMTGFKGYKVGSQVNIEVDLIARYLEKLMQANQVQK